MTTPNETATTASPLVGYIERIERLNKESADALAFAQDVYNEAKAHGFDPKLMKKLVLERTRDEGVVQDENAVLDLYRAEMRKRGSR
jgi:uncharacterized protein (UPF0335 family)